MRPSQQTANPPDSGEAGFTLMEALVALTILAFAATALIGAAQLHVQRIEALEARAIAQWVAENELVMVRLRGSGREQTQPVTMLGRNWRTDVALATTTDPDLASVEIRVTESGDREPDAIFHGFADVGNPAQ